MRIHPPTVHAFLYLLRRRCEIRLITNIPAHSHGREAVRSPKGVSGGTPWHPCRDIRQGQGGSDCLTPRAEGPDGKCNHLIRRPRKGPGNSADSAVALQLRPAPSRRQPNDGGEHRRTGRCGRMRRLTDGFPALQPAAEAAGAPQTERARHLRQVRRYPSMSSQPGGRTSSVEGLSCHIWSLSQPAAWTSLPHGAVVRNGDLPATAVSAEAPLPSPFPGTDGVPFHAAVCEVR